MKKNYVYVTNEEGIAIASFDTLKEALAWSKDWSKDNGLYTISYEGVEFICNDGNIATLL